MYTRNCYRGFDQKKNRVLDIYEFLISLAIPYFFILVANISLIRSLRKQNDLMGVSYSISNNMSLNSSGGGGNGNGSINSFRNRFRREPSRLRRFSTFNAPEFAPILEKSNAARQSHGSRLSLQQQETELNKNIKTIRYSNTIGSISSSINGAASSSINGAASTSSNANTTTATTTPSRIYSNLKLSALYRKTSNLREIKNQKKLTITLIIILCLLLFCYLPSFIFEESLANVIFGTHEPHDAASSKVIKIKSIGYRISILLIYINCSANFLIYCICNKKFKNSLKLLLKKSFLNSIYQRISNQLCKYCICWHSNKTNGNMALYDMHINSNRPHLAYCSHLRGSRNNNNNNSNSNNKRTGSIENTAAQNQLNLEQQHRRLFSVNDSPDITCKCNNFKPPNRRQLARANSNSVQTSSLRSN
jgi:hypothetical protein